MVKNWLIRTKNNHILGPISKDKVKELISNGSIKGDDEVCSGNGYWIFVRETELVAKYVFGNDIQGFNPVQEAETVLSNKILDENLPSDDDLEYPDMGEENSSLPDEDDLEYPDDITVVGGIDVSALKDDGDVRSNDVNSDPVNMRKKKTQPKPEVVTKKTNASAPKLKEKKSKQKKVSKSAKNSSLMSIQMVYFLVVAFFVVAVISFYFRKTIFSQFINNTSSLLIPKVYAQEVITKKKSGLNFLS